MKNREGRKRKERKGDGEGGERRARGGEKRREKGSELAGLDNPQSDRGQGQEEDRKKTGGPK